MRCAECQSALPSTFARGNAPPAPGVLPVSLVAPLVVLAIGAVLRTVALVLGSYRRYVWPPFTGRTLTAIGHLALEFVVVLFGQTAMPAERGLAHLRASVKRSISCRASHIRRPASLAILIA